MKQILIHSTETCCRISSYRKQWMDLITTSSPTSFFSTPRTPTGRMLSNKHVSESSCKWPGVYVVLHRTTIFYICIWLWQMFWRNTFLLSVTWNTWFSSWFGQEHISHQLMPHHIVSSPECSVVTSHPVASCHIITVQHGPSVGQIKQSLSTCGGFYTYRTEVVHGGGAIGSGCGSLPWIEEAT